jgi:hypothetical protein
MVIEYVSQSIFRVGKSSLDSENDTAPIEYDFIKCSADYCLDKWDYSYIKII